MNEVLIVYEVTVRASMIVKDLDLRFMGQMENLAFQNAAESFPGMGYTVKVVDFGIHEENNDE